MDKAIFVNDFRELDVYQRLYRLMLTVHKEILPKLPRDEKFNLYDQLRRSSQAAPALLAEGFAKRFQPRHWSKYLHDCIGEVQETMHHLSCAKDIHSQYFNQINQTNIIAMIDDYAVSIKQLYAFGDVLKKFHTKKSANNND